MKTLLLIIILPWVAVNGFSQQKITGIILADSSALAGATVQIKNKNRGAITDFTGRFEILAHKNDTLEVSYLGYRRSIYVLYNKQNIVIRMTESEIELDEILIQSFPKTSTTCLLQCDLYCLTTSCGTSISRSAYPSNELSPELATLYPNPSADGVFQLKLNPEISVKELVVFNLNGKRVHYVRHKPISRQIPLNLSSLSSGMYLVKLFLADGSSIVKRAIKK